MYVCLTTGCCCGACKAGCCDTPTNWFATVWDDACGSWPFRLISSRQMHNIFSYLIDIVARRVIRRGWQPDPARGCAHTCAACQALQHECIIPNTFPSFALALYRCHLPRPSQWRCTSQQLDALRRPQPPFLSPSSMIRCSETHLSSSTALPHQKPHVPSDARVVPRCCVAHPPLCNNSPETMRQHRILRRIRHALLHAGHSTPQRHATAPQRYATPMARRACQ